MLPRTLTSVTLNSQDIASFKEFLRKREKESELDTQPKQVFHEEDSVDMFLVETPMKRNHELIPSDDEDDLEGTLAKQTRFWKIIIKKVLIKATAQS